MKKIFTAILNSAFLILNCTAQTNVSGFISANTTWNLAGSPYVVVGNILLSQGYTLTIDPGVVVKFDSAKAIQIDGELIAVGNAANRITFTSNQTVPAAGDWAKIQFNDSAVGAVYDTSDNYVSGSIMKYCDVMYGGGLGYGAIHVDNSAPYISNCRVSYSAADGIHCIGAYPNIDFSSIKYNANYGITFGGGSERCPVLVQHDSIMYNSNGGFLQGGGVGGINCDTPYAVFIRNNYFYSNFQYGALRSFGNGFGDFRITGNTFDSNTLVNHPTEGVVYVDAPSYLIECNTFINNQANNGSTLYIFDQAGGTNHFIRKNTFQGNTATSGVAAATIWGNHCCPISFTDNRMRNNFSTTGSICKFRSSASSSNIGYHEITGNDFSNNQASKNIYLLINGIGLPSMQFVRFSLNNIVNPNCQYEIYNDAPFGGPNNYVDSNYWGNVTTQHLDSVIYDYFDDAVKSVIYYSPLMNSPFDVDTLCPDNVTAISEIKRQADIVSTIFPNPLTTTATIKFSRAVHAATLRMYNIYGQLIMETSNINGESFRLNAETFRSGVYVYEVTEKEKKICGGKAVVY